MANDIRERALADIAGERDRQEQLGWTTEHDVKHGTDHLLQLAGRYALDSASAGSTTDEQRADLIKCAALVVAAIELVDREIPPAAAIF